MCAEIIFSKNCGLNSYLSRYLTFLSCYRLILCLSLSASSQAFSASVAYLLGGLETNKNNPVLAVSSGEGVGWSLCIFSGRHAASFGRLFSTCSSRQSAKTKFAKCLRKILGFLRCSIWVLGSLNRKDYVLWDPPLCGHTQIFIFDAPIFHKRELSTSYVLDFAPILSSKPTSKCLNFPLISIIHDCQKTQLAAAAHINPQTAHVAACTLIHRRTEFITIQALQVTRERTVTENMNRRSERGKLFVHTHTYTWCVNKHIPALWDKITLTAPQTNPPRGSGRLLHVAFVVYLKTVV